MPPQTADALRLKSLGPQALDRKTWWTRGDSNPWPRECDSRALPAELRAHMVTILRPEAEYTRAPILARWRRSSRASTFPKV